MPYGRRRYRRRRVSRRRRTRAGVTKKYVKAVIRRAMRSDPHHYDFQITDAGVNVYTGNPYIHQLINVGVGDTQQSRDGKCIQLTGFQIRGSLYRNNASTSHDRVRLCVVQMKNTDSYAVGTIYSQLFDVDISSVSTALEAFRRLDGGAMPNFRILYDKVFDIGYGDTDKSTKVFKISRRFKRPVKCWFGTDSAASPITNNFFIMAISDNAASQPLLATSSRVWFLP